jgi:cysteine desulfurase
VAALLGCEPEEVVFTSGGSEANNLALKGLAFARGVSGVHIITTVVEHPSILQPGAFLRQLGARITLVPVDGTGRIDPDDVARAITPDTALISVMHANNEVGTLQPVVECGRIARQHGIAFHTDAAQSVGKVETRVRTLGVDLLTMAGHKFNAPKGIGALYVRRGLQLAPLIHGAAHENGRRAGTESAALCAAFGAACSIAQDLTPIAGVRALRDRLWAGLADRFGERVACNGHPEQRLPNTLNVSFLGRTGAQVLAACPDIAASTGSACHAGRVEISPVLRAMGLDAARGAGAVRFSLGRQTTARDIEGALRSLSAAA